MSDEDRVFADDVIVPCAVVAGGYFCKGCGYELGRRPYEDDTVIREMRHTVLSCLKRMKEEINHLSACKADADFNH
jgi:hypothetical protein